MSLRRALSNLAVHLDLVAVSSSSTATARCSTGLAQLDQTVLQHVPTWGRTSLGPAREISTSSMALGRNDMRTQKGKVTELACTRAHVSMRVHTMQYITVLMSPGSLHWLPHELGCCKPGVYISLALKDLS